MQRTNLVPLLALAMSFAFGCASPSDEATPTESADDEVVDGRPGSLDRAFGDRGLDRAAFPIGAAFERDGEGRIVTISNPPKTPNGKDYDFAIRRTLADGRPDPAFGSNGMVVTDLGGADTVDALAIGREGSILVGGATAASRTRDFAIARYSTGGVLDPTFGSAGVITTDLGGDDSAAWIAERPDGKLVVVGTSDGRIALVQLGRDGRLDESFGSGGKVVSDVEDGVRGVAIDARGRIVVARCRGGQGTVSLTRFSEDGAIDRSFGASGHAQTMLVAPAYGFSRTQADVLSVRPDGSILLAGTVAAHDGDRAFAVYRFTDAGALDGAFGRGGYAYVDMGDEDEEVNAMAVDEQERILLAGHAARTRRALLVLRFANREAAVLRLSPNGAPDESFGKRGRVLTDYGSDEDVVMKLVLLPEGRLVTLGEDDVGTVRAQYRR